MKKAGVISDFSVVELNNYKRLQFEKDDRDASGRPVKIPVIPLNHQVVAKVEYGDFSESEFFICDSVEDMQSVYASGRLMQSPIMVDWYSREK